MTGIQLGRLSGLTAVAMVFSFIGVACSSSGIKTTPDAAVSGATGGIAEITGAGGETSTSTAVTGAGGATIAATPGVGGAMSTSTTMTGAGGATNPIGTNGSLADGGGAETDSALAAGIPTITDSGYVTVSAGTTVLAGFVSSSEGGSGSSIALTYGPTSFCASGTVGMNTTYNCWANAGFNVNQNPSGASGSSGPLVLSGATISVSYVNSAGSPLEFELYDGSDYWCYELPPSTSPTTKTIPFSSLNTQCWNNSGSPFVSGTSITVVSLVVPGNNISATPFNFCFLGMTVQ